MSRHPLSQLAVAVFCLGFGVGIFSASASPWNTGDDTNVNSRYTVESVELNGIAEAKLSRALREDLRGRIGQKFSPDGFAHLAGKIREELKARVVSTKLLRGSNPEQVKVVLLVTGRRIEINNSPSRFAYSSRQGWTGEFTTEAAGVYVGVLSDDDTSIGRFSGLKAGYSHGFLQDRVTPAFRYSAMHTAFASETTLGAAPAGVSLYRSYQTFQPEVTFVPWRGDRQEVALTTGFRLQRFEVESPGSNRESSHSLVNTLRYRRVWGEEETGGSRLEAQYGLGFGSPGFSSDYGFTRQEVRTAVSWNRQRNHVQVILLGGALNGRAPLVERFALGNTSTLRGWSKDEIAPLGADRAVAATVEYGRGMKHNLYASAFFDTGSVWNRGATPTARNSTGFGVRTKDGFYIYVAFPLREGRVEPMLITGATF